MSSADNLSKLFEKKSGLIWIQTVCMRGSRNFRQGGGVQVKLTKKALTSFFEVPEGVQHFPGGSNFFQGGSNCSFPIETHITCDFPGGSGPPVPPPPSGSALFPGGSGPPVPPSGSALDVDFEKVSRRQKSLKNKR